MKQNHATNDAHAQITAGWSLCLALIAVLLCLATIGTLDMAQDEASGPLQMAARSETPARLPAVTARSDDADSFHGAHFVTDQGGSEPGPLQQ